MKNVKLLCGLGVFAVMGLGLLAEERQGGDAGPPAPAPAAGAQGGSGSSSRSS